MDAGNPADLDLAAALLRLEEDLLRPEVRRSRAEIEARLAPDFVEVGASGRTYDRPAMIAALVAEESGAVGILDFAVRRLADDVALATYRSVRSGRAGAPPTTALRASIWCRHAGRWRMVFHQGTPAG